MTAVGAEERVGATAAAMEAGVTELQARAAVAMAIAGRDRDEVRRLAERALATHPLLGTRGVVGTFARAFGTLVGIDDLAAAEGFAAAALELAAKPGAPIAAATAHGWHALVILQRGRLDAAAREAERALALGDPHTPGAGQSAAVLIRARLERGDTVGAAAALAAGPPVDPEADASLLEARGLLRLAEGRPFAARSDLRAAGALLVAGDGLFVPPVTSWRSHAAAAAAKLGRFREARRLAAADLARARAAAVPRTLGVALLTNGLLARRSGERIALLREAVAALEASPSRLELARALVELGSALPGDGLRPASGTPLRRPDHQPAAATPLCRPDRQPMPATPLRRGLDLAERLGATPLAARARGRLLAPPHRQPGSPPRRLPLTNPAALTGAERRVARLAVSGWSNAEIGAALLITPMTVDRHLRAACRKLGIATPEQLASALERAEAA
jgi:DNA-binding CsgD family transcriptional regulator